MSDSLSKLYNIEKREVIVLIVSIILGVIISIVYSVEVKSKNLELQQNVSEEVIRLHIRARSNSAEDQQFKLFVRDEVLNFIQVEKNTTSVEEAEDYINNNIYEIKKFVDDLIKKEGYNYTSTVLLDEEYFSEKQYGNITLPEGVYNSLIINLDEGEGDNWWCVVFPPLCFIDEEDATFEQESYEILSQNLEEDEINYITSKNNKIKMKFKFFN